MGGSWRKVSRDQPLVLEPHQVAVVKTHEVINIPRFLIARWNLRVQWVYEGLLWVGGPQVDPGWQGALYCPIYNLAERQVVIPHKERVFTMDFTRTTPFQEKPATYGYAPKKHKFARDKNIEAHDRNRLRSAPFESLSRLATLDSRVTSFITLTFVVLAVVIAAIGVIASLSGGGSEALNEEIKQDSGIFVLTVVALVFGLSGLIIGSLAMLLKFGPPPQRGVRLALLTFFGAVFLGVGTGHMGVVVTSGLPDWPSVPKALLTVGTVLAILFGSLMLYGVWHRATTSERGRWF